MTTGLFIRASASDDLAICTGAVSLKIEAAAGESAPGVPKVSIVAYTGGPIKQPWSPTVYVDLAGMEIPSQTIPLLKDHSQSIVVGHTTKASIADGQLLIEGVMSGVGASASEIVGSAKNGFPWQASIGAEVLRVEELKAGAKAVVNGREVTGPAQIARATRLREVSIVSIGADSNTAARIAAARTKESNMEFSAWLKANGHDLANLTNEKIVELAAEWRKTQAEPVEPEKPAPDNADPVTTLRASTAAEIERVGKITTIAASYQGLDPKVTVEAIRAGWTPEAFELKVLRETRPKIAAAHTDSQVPNRAAIIEASMLSTLGWGEDELKKHFKPEVLEAASSPNFRNITITGLMSMVIRAAGDHEPASRSGESFIRASFEADRKLSIQANAGGFSPISLAGILGNVANKVLLEAYTSIEDVASQICQIRPAKDFKAMTSYRLESNGLFAQVAPTGELKSVQLSEQSYTNQVTTRGSILTLSRVDIINDDLGSFAQLPQIIGRNAQNAVQEAVFGRLLANTGNFFSSGNKNVITGATTALGIEGLRQAIKALREQVDSAGKPINVTPRKLLVPPALEMVARQLFAATLLNETTTANTSRPATNIYAGQFDPLVSPYLATAAGLPGASDTAWYLMADPANMPALQLAFLNGQRTPVLESSGTDFDTLGIRWRAYMDFGVAFQDPRAAVRSAGA